MKTLTKSQAKTLRYAKQKYNNGHIPPFLFRDYRSIKALLDNGFIQFEHGYGAPMYRFTQSGLDVLGKVG
jgi:hypothetical protein